MKSSFFSKFPPKDSLSTFKSVPAEKFSATRKKNDNPLTTEELQKKTIQKLSQEKCTGCGACFNSCPVQAIQMKISGEGFLYPEVEIELCIGCSLCQKHCPELSGKQRYAEAAQKQSYYAMMADWKIRKVSSSGGMFTLLAKYVFKHGGYVCGAAYSEDYKEVHHIIISNEKELWRIRGSKYVQSSLGTCFKELEEYLKKGRYVLFTGTPCQVSGFQKFLGQDYEHLLTADIVCHGTPSPKVYRKYIEEKSDGRNLTEVNFREKDFWGWGTATSLFFDNGTSFRADCFKDEYLRGFLGGLETRFCCGSCQYANPDRIGDFTLGDFWGVDEIDKTLSDGKGTSLVKVNSKKAEEILPKIRKDCTLLEEVEEEKVLDLAGRRNGQLRWPRRNHWARGRFFELIDCKTMTQAFDWAINSRYDVGILGWWYNENYGGALTYFALYQVLRKMGLSVLMIAKCSRDPNYQPKYDSIPYRFAMKNYHISKNYTPEGIRILNNHCRTFISGSDQLFNPTLWEYSGPEYFLDFVDPKNNLISCASSFGNEFIDRGDLTSRMSYWLRRFDALSVRESYGVDICHDVFGLKAENIMDPVFLCDVSEYEKQAEKSGLKKEFPYVLSFILDPTPEKSQAVRNACKKLGMKMVNLMNASDIENNTKRMALDNMKPNADIEEWLFWYMNADFVITDSFHGTCFAIIFKKKFISLANFQRGENRFISLLEDVGLMDHLVRDLKEISLRPELYEDINYDDIYGRINPKIQASYQWLENAIKHIDKKYNNDFQALIAEIERLKRRILQLEEKTKNI